jgi:glycosyltransferase involved in cell wall biosynthesis
VAVAYEHVAESGRVDTLREMGVDVRLSTPKYLGKYLHEISADIFHIHRAGWPEQGPITAAKEAGIPIIVEHNVFGRIDDTAEGAMVDCHIFVSYFCAARYQAWLGSPLVGSKYEVLYNPVDIRAYDSFGYKDRDYKGKVFGRLGRNDNSKWDFNMLEAVPIILDSVPGSRFRAMGETPEVVDFLHKRNVSEKVDFVPMTGDENAIMEFYKSIDLFTHFAEMGETFGIVLAESMAARIPVVTHTTPSPKDSAQTELIEHCVNGFVARSPAEYADAVITLLTNPASARGVGMKGYDKAMMICEAEKITRGLESLFETLVIQKGIG